MVLPGTGCFLVNVKYRHPSYVKRAVQSMEYSNLLKSIEIIDLYFYISMAIHP